LNLPPWLSALLWPFSLLYGGAVRLRAWFYRVGIFPQRRLKGMVISVGNLTVGGTGKTPMVMYMAQHLLDRGKSVGILSRGYRILSHAQTDRPPHTPGEEAESIVFSDETWQLHRELKGRALLGIGADRFRHGQELERRGVEWFLLDDGFQHLRLARDADIVLIDGTAPFGNGRLLPAGSLREPCPALARADLILITRRLKNSELESIVRRYSPAPIFFSQTELKEVAPANNSAAPAEPHAWLGRRAFVFCGIGNPAAFFADVRQWGLEVVGEMAFRDHHAFAARDLEEIESAARRSMAEILVCTDKDTFNLGRHAFRSLPLYVCRITMRLSDERGFWEALYSILERRRAGRKP
jgi:tetraacyldisaccharide 4'-kinase